MVDYVNSVCFHKNGKTVALLIIPQGPDIVVENSSTLSSNNFGHFGHGHFCRVCKQNFDGIISLVTIKLQMCYFMQLEQHKHCICKFVA